jgi:hypothetical protein
LFVATLPEVKADPATAASGAAGKQFRTQAPAGTDRNAQGPATIEHKDGHSVKINGPVNVYTQDAAGFAADLREANSRLASSMKNHGAGGRATQRSQSKSAPFFDMVTEESHHSELKVTDNPLESGSWISDPAILTPRPFEVTGIMEDFDSTATLFNQLAKDNYVREPDFIDDLPIPGEIKSLTAQGASLASRDQVASAANSLVGSSSGHPGCRPSWTRI